MIFDVEMGENFRRKYWFVADGHKTKTLSAMTYSNVVSSNSIRIVLTVAALNDLGILECDIQNTYLTAEYKVQVSIVAIPEFGSESGQCMLI